MCSSVISVRNAATTVLECAAVVAAEVAVVAHAVALGDIGAVVALHRARAPGSRPRAEAPTKVAIDADIDRRLKRNCRRNDDTGRRRQ